MRGNALGTVLAPVAVASLLLAGCSAESGPAGQGPACSATAVEVGEMGSTISRIIEGEAEGRNLTSVLYRVTQGGEVIAGGVIGDGISGVPVTGAEHFRNGNVAFAYVGTLLMLMAEAGEVSLDDTVGEWLPDRDLPNADTVTLRMLADHTSGYPDYVPTDAFLDAFNDDPFQYFTPEELLEFAFATPPLYPPGTGWNYSHANYILLGEALAAAAGQGLGELLTERVLEPMGLADTVPVATPELPEPALHTYSTERGLFEETTFWNPSWQTAPGAVLATNLCDLSASVEAVGTGELLSEESFAEMTADSAVQHADPPADCPPGVCRSFPDDVHFGLGVIVVSDWIAQTPLFGGQGTIHAYLPEEDLAVAIVAVTGQESEPNVNHAQEMWTRITQAVTPENVPPF